MGNRKTRMCTGKVDRAVGFVGYRVINLMNMKVMADRVSGETSGFSKSIERTM
jgi:hypothetical protein